VVHLVRNSLRYASKAHWGKISADLKAVYTSSTLPAAEARFAEFADNWRQKYPAMVAMWERSWNEFIPFLDFPIEIRKLIYTTNGIESLNARFRQAVRRRGHFPTEQAGRNQPVNATPQVRGEVHDLGASGDQGRGAAAVLVADSCRRGSR
jgi:putative transposase